MKIFNFLCFISSITFFLNSDINDNSKLTPVSLKNLITENGAKNNIIYTYTDWCAPCIKEFPDVLKFCEKNNCKLYIIILSKDGNANLNKYQEKLLKKYNCKENLYNYSFDKDISSTLSKSNYRNYQAFIKELIGEKYDPNILYGSDNLILMNNKAKVIYIPQNLEYKDIFANIKKLLE